MVGQFGSREICDVTFKALNEMTIGSKTFKAGMPVFIIDTATASTMEQATNTVYANGGKGYNRLIAWEGEKTMTFTVTDALMSPMGLKVLSGAGFAKEADEKHIHVTYDVTATVAADGTYAVAEVDQAKLANELGIPVTKTIKICVDSAINAYATILDSFGGIKDWADGVDFEDEEDGKLVELKENETVDAYIDLTGASDTYTAGQSIRAKLDFYVLMTTEASEIMIRPDDFGGNFYVEADTLYRNRAGKDMAATLTFPNVKIQSGFSIAMSANGDPSTFDFVMDAFPAYTYFSKEKVICDITIVSGDDSMSQNVAHDNDNKHDAEPAAPTTPTVTIAAPADPVTNAADKFTVKVSGTDGVRGLKVTATNSNANIPVKATAGENAGDYVISTTKSGDKFATGDKITVKVASYDTDLKTLEITVTQ